MNMKTTIISLVLLVVIAGTGYYFVYPYFNTIEVDDELPMGMTEAQTAPADADANGQADIESTTSAQGAEVVVVGPFSVEDTPAHPASGNVRVFKNTNETVIRYENYDTINGPNLHVYLAKDLEANEYIDLGPIKGTTGNINYTIPEGIDIEEYPFLLTWCVPFGVLFNYAELR
ncbi:MAG: DM13 domain-containing protein [Candidatus Paceibacterota bacterium]